MACTADSPGDMTPRMKQWLPLLCCAVLAGCERRPVATERERIEKPPSQPAQPEVKAVADSKPAAPKFDLIRDTARVRENLVGAWYQVDHMRDGSTSALTVVKYFADGTVRDEYWGLDHRTRIATHGTDQGRWEMRGDTIVLHIEGQPAAASSAVVPKSASTPASPADLPAAAPAATNESILPHDDEQRLLEAAADWFTYEYRVGFSAGSKDPQPPSIAEGVSVRVSNDFKLPRSIPGYRREGTDLDPPTATEKFFQRIFR